ncbi:MAG TPA: hypothetical protein VN824_08140, partial [Puia sp.]|nr:hypothetical protein [Puia sp.]
MSSKMIDNQYKRRWTRGQLTGIMLLMLLWSGLSSCKKYLDERPNKTQVVPSTYQDLEAVLDNVTVMNRTYPSAGEGA